MSVTTERLPGTLDVRPFHVDIPEAELTELRRRIAELRASFGSLR